MKVILFKAILNLIFLGIGLVQLNESKRDALREMPRWFCFITRIFSYIIIATGFSIWFW